MFSERIRRLRQMSYHTPSFQRAKQMLRESWHPCWVTDADGPCARRGTIPDHYPPLSTVADPREWHGVLLPMCDYHSRKQSGSMRHGKPVSIPPATRSW